MEKTAVVTDNNVPKKERAKRQMRTPRTPETPEQKITRIQDEIKNLQKDKRRIDLEVKKRELELEFLQEEGK